ncbi:hypothetical protein AB5N19_07016 [Seiridium cardinale]|uniref:Uncharacterized protein n=1 Tax=Seiridium cardinale TaxID=138064 RepID=A0ABR2XE68_9PEZI
MHLEVPLATLALHLASVNSQRLTKPALWPNLDKFGPTLTSELPRHNIGIQTWQAGTISSGCRDVAVRDGFSPNQFQAYSVTFDDVSSFPPRPDTKADQDNKCAQSWNFCIQTGSSQSIEDLAAAFGQAPVRMRQWTSEVVLEASGGGANAWKQIITMKQPGTPQVFIHEISHTADSGGGYKSPSASTSTAWVGAYNVDLDVPDTYAQTNQQENFAQFGNLIIYDRITNGQLRNETDLYKIGNQLNTMADQADNGQYGGRLFDVGNGLTCTARYANTAPVNVNVVGHIEDEFAKNFTIEAQMALGVEHGISVMAELPAVDEPTTCLGL